MTNAAIVITGCAIVAATLVVGCSRKGNPPFDGRIVGSWSNVGGDYLLTNEYRADGTFVQHSGALSGKPLPFRIESGQIIVTLTQPNGTQSEDKSKFEISGDTLTLTGESGFKSTFRRDK